ncbi:MAG: putative S-adenosylmethionine-dependent methyltransferase [Chloroflexi bacterium]|nr:putative S-adenosylmethionine-dependent methyltransferase [Chloroflexota bacterium]
MTSEVSEPKVLRVRQLQILLERANFMRFREGEYAHKGDYHRSLDPSWPYLPVYLEKMSKVRQFLDKKDPQKRILDAGCGEGVLVEEFHQRGYSITGLDLNYSSDLVKKGSILDIPYPDGVFDIVLNLDVLEHLSFKHQKVAVGEFARVLKPNGILFVSVPNLAHFASRLTFVTAGKLARTSESDRHIGDRPIGEFIALFRKHFHIRSRKGIFPTYPLLSLLTLWKPSKVVALHKLYNSLAAYPNWCFLNLMVCEKKGSS